MSSQTASSSRPGSRSNRPSNRAVAIGILVVSLILAGVVSFYAASDPDGLTKVSQDEGFASTEKTHHTADGPFAGYSSSFIDNGRLSGGFAGIVGVGVVLVLAGGLVLITRRRSSGPSEASEAEAPQDAA